MQTTALPTDGRIVSYVTDFSGNKVGWVFSRGYEYHTVLFDDRFTNEEINTPHPTVDDAVFEGIARQYLYDHIDQCSAAEAEIRMQDAVDMWDEAVA